MPIIGNVISESYRILKPGGTFIVADLKKHNNELMRKTYGDLWLGFDQKDIERWLTLQGFNLINKTQFNIKKSLSIFLYKTMKTI